MGSKALKSHAAGIIHKRKVQKPGFASLDYYLINSSNALNNAPNPDVMIIQPGEEATPGAVLNADDQGSSTSSSPSVPIRRALQLLLPHFTN